MKLWSIRRWQEFICRIMATSIIYMQFVTITQEGCPIFLLFFVFKEQTYFYYITILLVLFCVFNCFVLFILFFCALHLILFSLQSKQFCFCFALLRFKLKKGHSSVDLRNINQGHYTANVLNREGQSMWLKGRWHKICFVLFLPHVSSICQGLNVFSMSFPRHWPVETVLIFGPDTFALFCGGQIIYNLQIYIVKLITLQMQMDNMSNFRLIDNQSFSTNWQLWTHGLGNWHDGVVIFIMGERGK